MERENKFVSLVVYLHDNENCIEKFLETVVKGISERFTQVELVCVDDATLGNEIAIVRKYVKENLPEVMVNIVHMSYYQGLENSMNAGRDLAIGDFIYEFDSVEIDYEFSVVTDVYEKMLEGFDIVSATSSVKPKLTSRLFYKIFNYYSKAKSIKLKSDSFRIITRRAINRAKSMGTFIPYRKAVYANSGLKNANVVYTSTTGLKRRTKNFNRTGLALDSFVYFTRFLESISTVLSVLFLLVTVGIVGFILSDIFLHHSTADGWLSLMGFLSIGFFGVFLLLTIILKYLSTLLNVVFRQKSYVIEDIEKITREGKE